MILLLLTQAHAAELGGYFRVMARPDLVGGDARLGDSALYGRLLNEGPWALVHVRQALLPKEGRAPWADVHLRVEGGSLPGADGGNGALDAFRISQFYFQAGNLGAEGVTFRLGTLETTFGDLWLFDARPTQMLVDVLGASATWTHGDTEVVAAVGDAGWSRHGAAYHAVPSAGGSLTQRLGEHVAVGVGGQAWYEAADADDPYAPFDTPGLTVNQWSGGGSWVAGEPPAPVARDASGWKLAGYLGFGKMGPVSWDRLQVVWQQRMPDVSRTETIDGETVSLGGASLTDERRELFVGNEMELVVIPDRLEVAWATQLDHRTDGDDDAGTGSTDRTAIATVVRAQLAVTPHVGLLGETSAGREIAHNGPAFRLSSTKEAAFRDTWQGKAGVVLSPGGPAMSARPSLRLLYGAQYSTATSAWPGATAVDRPWHHLVSLEAEAWF